MNVVGVLIASAASLNVRAQFDDYMRAFSKVYESIEEEELRFRIFAGSLEAIANGNAERAARGAQQTQGLTRFADWTPEEFRARFLTLKPRRTFAPPGAPMAAPSREACPACTRFPKLAITRNMSAWDWTHMGAVTAVKDQSGCGACWAFSVSADVEGTHFLAGNNLTNLSMEQLISCDPEAQGQGCTHGGEPSLAMKYVVDAGLTSLEAYPFKDAQGPPHTHCSPDKIVAPLARISSWDCVSSAPNPKDTGLADALVRLGPLSNCIDASAMMHYSSGVDDPVSTGPDRQCEDGHTNHAVLIVGYGVDRGKPYWKIKNSWGTAWGEQGFYRVVRGENKCGLATDVVHSVAAGV